VTMPARSLTRTLLALLVNTAAEMLSTRGPTQQDIAG
jgi:hypothetical protein